MSLARKLSVAWLVTTVVLFAPWTAHAAPPPAASPDPEDAAREPSRDRRAREHFDLGVRLYDGKPPDYAGALSEFEAAMRERPSWVIEQNIALALRALRRYPEALDALEEALRLGGADIKPDARAQIDAAVSELAPLIAVLHVSVRSPHKKAPSDVVLVVDGVRQKLESGEATIRVGVGEHVVEVLSPRVAKKDSVRVAGRERAEVVVLVPSGEGTLVVHADAGDHVVVSGIARGDGTLTLSLPPGPAEVEVVRRAGGSYVETVVVPEDDSVVVTVPALQSPSAAGNDSDGDNVRDAADGIPHNKKDRLWLLEAGGTGAYTNLRLGAPLGESTEGKNRAFYGGTFLLRAGRRISESFGLGLAAEIGSATTFDYASPVTSGSSANTRLDTWALGGGLSFATPGVVSLAADATLSFLGQDVTTTLDSTTKPTDTRHASGIDAAFTVDAGARYVWDRVTVGAFLFGTLHGVGGVLDASNARALLDEPGFRVGVRVLVGVRL